MSQGTARMTVSLIAASLALAFVLMLAMAGSAFASEAVDSFEVTTTTTQAGGHPDLSGALNLHDPGQPEAAKDVVVNLPEGLFGNPQAITTCHGADFALNRCPIGSQAGLVSVRANYSGNPNFILGTAPLYDLQAQGSEETARFAFVVPILNIPIAIPVAVRTGSDYGLRLTVAGITQQMPLAHVDWSIWGVPADPSHDEERFPIGSPGLPSGCPGQGTASCNELTPHGAGIEPHPLTDNPTVCTGQPLAATVEVQTYEDPDHPSNAEAAYPPTTGCASEVFNPFMDANLTTSATDSPAGLDLQLNAPQFEGTADSPSEIRSAKVILPEGLSINPDAADGQIACQDALANFDSEGPAHCPDTSKIGTFKIETAALTGPLTGSLYIGEPKPGDQYRVFMIAAGFGINAKLIASFHPDPQTGQLTMSLDHLPQVPFDGFGLHLFSSDRGLVATPTVCTVYQVDSVFTPWNSSLAPQHSDPFLSLTTGPNGGPCPGRPHPFNPHLIAGTSNPRAGAFSNFILRLDREDGDQFLSDLNFRMPPGFTGDLRGITYCSEAAIAAAAQTAGKVELAEPSCPASSQIGTTNVAAGPGSHPFHAVGRMYLSGPFKGAPLSLVAITPALAGPYDYGTVVIRVALHVDPLTAQVSAISETMPSIIGGIPIRMRSIQVNIDREHFTINPTNCSPFSVDSEGIGDEGTVANFSSYFHAVNCFSLPFKPKMSITQLGGHKNTIRAKDPSIRFDLGARAGDANIKSIAVTLPNALEIDQNHLGNLCAKSELEATHCAGRQPIGKVKDETPLLEAPLEGNAYAVSGYTGLPHVAFILGGQVMIVPQGESKETKQGLRTTVPTVPDVPIGHFQLTLFGAKQGYLSNTQDLCGHAVATRIEYSAQNGKTLTQRVPIKTACGSKGKRPKRHRH